MFPCVQLAFIAVEQGTENIICMRPESGLSPRFLLRPLCGEIGILRGGLYDILADDMDSISRDGVCGRGAHRPRLPGLGAQLGASGCTLQSWWLPFVPELPLRSQSGPHRGTL